MIFDGGHTRYGQLKPPTSVNWISSDLSAATMLTWLTSYFEQFIVCFRMILKPAHLAALGKCPVCQMISPPLAMCQHSQKTSPYVHTTFTKCIAGYFCSGFVNAINTQYTGRFWLMPPLLVSMVRTTHLVMPGEKTFSGTVGPKRRPQRKGISATQPGSQV